MEMGLDLDVLIIANEPQALMSPKIAGGIGWHATSKQRRNQNQERRYEMCCLLSELAKSVPGHA